MKRGLALALTAAATTAALYAPVTADAAAPYFRSCAALTAKWPNGVAKGPVAANKAVRDGYSRPATSPLAKRVYWANYTRLDRDREAKGSCRPRAPPRSRRSLARRRCRR